MRKRMQGLLVPLMLAAALGTAHAQMQTRGQAPAAEAPPASSTLRSPIVVDGNGWMAASTEERRAFLIGVANMIVAENAYAQRRNLPAPGAGGRITETLRSMNLYQASERITAWYRANPDRQGTPVMGVIWRHLVPAAQ